MLRAVFSSWEERLAYYEYHQLDSYSDKLNYNDALRGRETPAERRARNSGDRSRSAKGQHQSDLLLAARAAEQALHHDDLLLCPAPARLVTAV